jgi:hypothetical protein
MQGATELASAQIITWLLVILGWYLVNRQNNAREKRKELRALLDQTQKLLDDIETQAIAYHTVEATGERAFFLKCTISQKLKHKLDVLSRRSLNLESSLTLLKELRKSITLNNFDSASYEKKELSDPLVRDIWLSKDRLSHELEKCFARKYP